MGFVPGSKVGKIPREGKGASPGFFVGFNPYGKRESKRGFIYFVYNRGYQLMGPCWEVRPFIG